MALLDGQVAIVTGAAVGIGSAYARALAAEGADLGICDIREDIEDLAAELRGSGRRVVSFVADVGKPDDVRRVVDGTVRELGGLDVLVSNAGVYPFTSIDDPLDKALADFDLAYGAHLRGVFLFGRAAIPHLIARGGGHIINVATDHHCTCGAPNVWSHAEAPGCRFGEENPRPTGTRADIYDSSKVAITGLTLAWAKALRPHNIRVNALCMGATDSFMLRSIFPSEPPADVVATWMRPEAIAQLVLDLIREGPDGRTGENIGAAVGHPVRLPGRQVEPIFSGTLAEAK
jgi:NAD(P)-dependent dehydrogenase (short-subunit alcohol dehydrogenase family)